MSGSRKKPDSFFDDDEEEDVADEAVATTPEDAQVDEAGQPIVALPEGQTDEPAAEQDPLPLTIVSGSPGQEPAEDRTSYEGEHLPPLNGESWVVLSDDESVPPRYQGELAAVIDPIPVATSEPDPMTGQTYQFTSPDAQLHVRVRSQGTELWVGLAGVKKISLSGRANLASTP